LKGFKKYAVEKGTGAVIFIPSLIKSGSGFRKLIGRGGEVTGIQTTWRINTWSLSKLYAFLTDDFVCNFPLFSDTQIYVACPYAVKPCACPCMNGQETTGIANLYSATEANNICINQGNEPAQLLCRPHTGMRQDM
jgi:hypothetical protein